MSLISQDELEQTIGTAESKEGAYALDRDGQRMYPLHDRDSLQKAAEHFMRHRGRYPYEWRREIATNLLKKADQLGCEVPDADYMKKAAGRGMGEKSEIAAHLMFRSRKIPGVKDDLEKLARTVHQSEEIGPKEASAAARVMAQVDESTDLYRGYGDALPFPEEVAFSHTEDEIQKTASSMVKLANEAVVTREQLQRAPVSKVAAAIGGEFEQKLMEDMFDHDTFTKLASDLDPDDADTLCVMLPEAQQQISFS